MGGGRTDFDFVTPTSPGIWKAFQGQALLFGGRGGDKVWFGNALGLVSSLTDVESQFPHLESGMDVTQLREMDHGRPRRATEGAQQA